MKERQSTFWNIKNGQWIVQKNNDGILFSRQLTTYRITIMRALVTNAREKEKTFNDQWSWEMQYFMCAARMRQRAHRASWVRIFSCIFIQTNYEDALLRKYIRLLHFVWQQKMILIYYSSHALPSSHTWWLPVSIPCRFALFCAFVVLSLDRLFVSIRTNVPRCDALARL